MSCKETCGRSPAKVNMISFLLKSVSNLSFLATSLSHFVSRRLWNDSGHIVRTLVSWSKVSNKEVVRIVQSAPSKLSSLSLRWSCPLSFYNVSPKLYILFSRIISFLFLSFSSSPAWRLLGFSDALSGFHLNCLNWPPPALPHLCPALLCPALHCLALLFPALHYPAQPCHAKVTATDPLLPRSQQSTLERSESPLHTPYSLRLRACQARPNG